jgi:hypothetical protein
MSNKILRIEKIEKAIYLIRVEIKAIRYILFSGGSLCVASTVKLLTPKSMIDAEFLSPAGPVPSDE